MPTGQENGKIIFHVNFYKKIFEYEMLIRHIGISGLLAIFLDVKSYRFPYIVLLLAFKYSQSDF